MGIYETLLPLLGRTEPKIGTVACVWPVTNGIVGFYLDQGYGRTGNWYVFENKGDKYAIARKIDEDDGLTWVIGEHPLPEMDTLLVDPTAEAVWERICETGN